MYSMSVEKLRKYFSYTIISAVLMSIIGACDAMQNTVCTPLTWSETLKRDDLTTIGRLKLVNSGGQLIVVPITKSSTRYEGDSLITTTTENNQIVETVASGTMTYSDGPAHYTIDQNPTTFDTVIIDVQKDCAQSAFARTSD